MPSEVLVLMFLYLAIILLLPLVRKHPTYQAVLVADDVVAEVALILKDFLLALKNEVDRVGVVHPLAADAVGIVPPIEGADNVFGYIPRHILTPR
jgi:hypothetical protein